MLERFLARFKSPAPAEAPLDPNDARLALATLLVRVAMADRAYLFEEVEAIDRILGHAFELGPIESAKLRADAERCSSLLPADADLAETIQNSVDYAHRCDTVQALWAVAEADGVTVASEAAIVDLVESHMGVAAEDNAAARARAAIP